MLFFFAMLFAALFAFLETSFTALRLFKVKELSKQASRFKWLFDAWENNPRRILITILIASNLADVLTSVLITDIVQGMLGDTGLSLAIGVFVATALILVFGEILPKSFAKAHPDAFFSSSLWLINTLFYIFYPMVTVLMMGTDFLTRRFGGKVLIDVEKADVITEKEIEFLIGYGDEKGVIESEKSVMLQNVFSLGETLAKEIMIPTPDIVAINVDETLEKAMALFIKYKFTRLPVYEDKDDNIIGIIHQKDVLDLLYHKEKKSLRELVIPVLFVPETNKINQLLREFLKKRLHMAMVVSEHGEVIGLITLEDIIEEIVGEIVDEHEKVHHEVVPLEDGGWLVDARIDLEKLEPILKLKFESEESVTLGGFLAECLQHLPKKGERVLYKGYCFQIQRATSRRVQQVLIFEEKEI